MYKSFSSVDELPSDCVVFKHSVTCPVSGAAKKEIDGYAEDHDVYLLIVQEQQELKMSVANTYGVQHESPQVLVIEEGKAVKVFNHWDVKASSL